MSTSRKRLPVNPSAEHLRKQAKRRVRDEEGGPLAEAQHALAQEYGCKSWSELMHVVQTMSRGAQQLKDVKQQLEPLPAAANRSDLGEVRRILAEESFTQHDLDLALARSVLAFDRRREIAELLVEHGADVDGQYGSNYGPVVFVTCECIDPGGLQFLIDNGADVAFAPIASKYGPASPMIALLGTYVRGQNARKHRCIDILVAHGAFIPPEVTPPMLAIHRGDVPKLAQLIDEDPSLMPRRFAQMPYGRIPLAGATLLHLAVEFGELECARLLVERGASVNARASVTAGLGGQTPIFHAIGIFEGSGLPILEYLLDGAKQWIDLSAKARFRVFDEEMQGELSPLDFAQRINENKDSPELKLLQRMNRPRIDDPVFASAVDALEKGDLPRITALLQEFPNLATARAQESGSFAGPYFAKPALLWFIAENPRRTGSLPTNIVEMAEAIIVSGAAQADLDYTAGLIASGDVPRRQGLTAPLLELLVRSGANPSAALTAAVQERNQDAIAILRRLGARPGVAAAAGLGELDALRTGLQMELSPQTLKEALYNAAVNGQTKAIEVLIREAGVDASLRIGLGTTALHLTAWNGDGVAVEMLLAIGADPTLLDTQYLATPAQWAARNGKVDLVSRLRSAEEAWRTVYRDDAPQIRQ